MLFIVVVAGSLSCCGLRLARSLLSFVVDASFSFFFVCVVRLFVMCVVVWLLRFDVCYCCVLLLFVVVVVVVRACCLLIVGVVDVCVVVRWLLCMVVY